MSFVEISVSLVLCVMDSQVTRRVPVTNRDNLKSESVSFCTQQCPNIVVWSIWLRDTEMGERERERERERNREMGFLELQHSISKLIFLMYAQTSSGRFTRVTYPHVAQWNSAHTCTNTSLGHCKVTLYESSEPEKNGVIPLCMYIHTQNQRTCLFTCARAYVHAQI